MKKIKIDNEKILVALKEKDEMGQRLVAIAEEGKELEKEANKLVAKMQREDEKVRPLMKEEVDKVEMGEWEEASRVYLGKEGDEEGKVILEVADRLEEFKVNYKQAKDAQNNSGDPAKDDGLTGPNPKVVTTSGKVSDSEGSK